MVCVIYELIYGLRSKKLRFSVNYQTVAKHAVGDKPQKGG